MTKPYPKEFRDDVVRVVHNREPGFELSQIAKDFGIHFTTLYSWMKKADVEAGERLGTTAIQSSQRRATVYCSAAADCSRASRSKSEGDSNVREATCPSEMASAATASASEKKRPYRREAPLKAAPPR